MKPFFLSAALAAVIALPMAPVSAATFLPANNEVTSVRDEIQGDLYTANNSIVIAAPVRGDIFAAGDSIDISGPNDQSIFAVGRTVTLSGSVGDDVRTAGSIVSINGSVEGDLFAAGSAITISQNASIAGDAYIAGEEMAISGKVMGDMRFAGNKVTITKNANITGNVTIYGTNDPIIEEGATIIGNVTTQKPVHDDREDSRKAISGVGRSVLAQLALALALLFAAPIATKQAHHVLNARPFYSFAIGAVWMILLLPVTLLLLVSGIGIHIGLLLMFATVPLLIASLGIALITMGTLAHRAFSKTSQAIIWHHGVYGALIMFALTFLNILGFMVAALVVIGSFGAVLISLWSAVSGKK